MPFSLEHFTQLHVAQLMKPEAEDEDTNVLDPVIPVGESDEEAIDH